MGHEPSLQHNNLTAGSLSGEGLQVINTVVVVVDTTVTCGKYISEAIVNKEQVGMYQDSTAA